jgi:hypothetical protein
LPFYFEITSSLLKTNYLFSIDLIDQMFHNAIFKVLASTGGFSLGAAGYLYDLAALCPGLSILFFPAAFSFESCSLQISLECSMIYAKVSNSVLHR